MRTLTVLALALIFLGSTRLVQAQQTVGQAATDQTPSKSPQGPSLGDTISFMNKSVRPEDGYVSSANHCEVEVLRNRTYTFGIPKGTHLKSTDQLGVPHYGLDWVYVEEPNVTRFRFETVDPRTIHSRVLPSIPFIKQHDLDDNISEAKEADLTVVFFDSTNSSDSIGTGHLGLAGENQGAPIFDHQASRGFIVFESKDRAERFVTAFLHAVELCGGKTSDFAPTPSKP